MSELAEISRKVTECRACPRLVAWREQVAREKRRAYRTESYWGRGVPALGDPKAWLLLLGLAPAAHGANRTGRMFTGDRSGDFLFAALHREGFANQPTSLRADDGLTLKGAFITAPCRCAPPDNKPLPEELERCAPFFRRELELLRPKVVLTLGAIGWGAACRHFGLERPRPKFGHGAEVKVPDGPWLLGAFHVSQQNTQTGRLTPAMFDAVLRRARELGER